MSVGGCDQGASEVPADGIPPDDSTTGGATTGGATAGGAGMGGATATPEVDWAKCQVNGVVYPHGAQEIPSPYDCSACACDDGHLKCDAATAPKTCPGSCSGHKGETCVRCGENGCEIKETTCLPFCDLGWYCLGGPCVAGICVGITSCG